MWAGLSGNGSALLNMLLAGAAPRGLVNPRWLPSHVLHFIWDGGASLPFCSLLFSIFFLFPSCCLSTQQSKCTFEHVDGFPGDESQSCQGTEGLGISLLSHCIHQSKLQNKHTLRVVVVVDGLHLLKWQEWYTCAGWKELLLANYTSNPL